jgi:rhodanese-related sulfurtransferase
MVKEKKFVIVAFLIIIILIVVAVAYILLPYIFQSNNENGLTLTTIYYNKDPEEVFDIMNNTENLTIIDCRGLEGCSSCQFKKGHLPNASMNDNPTTLFNSTNDILVYSKDGSIGAEFCIDLVNHVYGNIYNLKGGYEAWLAKNFTIETGLPD